MSRDPALQVGIEVIRSYRRLDYTPWYALAEFVDNATQSYRNNRRTLDRQYREAKTGLTVSIDYDADGGVLVVRDNAMGMSYDELEHALHIGKPPKNSLERSQFGLGLKTAACWFGNLWSVTTKKLGEPEGHQILVDVEKVASGELKLPYKSFEAPVQEHYTEVRIEQLHVTLKTKRLFKTREMLKSLYRVDMREGKLNLTWGSKQLAWVDQDHLLRQKDGEQVRVDIDFHVGGRRVKGWAGVLGPSSAGRSRAGFSLIRHGRLIRVGWRPESIFGPSPGRNDLINQRVVGELELDAFDVTHTKDGINWQGNEEDDVDDELKVRTAKVLEVARSYRHETEQVATPTPVSRESAVRAAMQTSHVIPRMKALAPRALQVARGLPSKRVLEHLQVEVGKRVSRSSPLASVGIEGGSVDVLLATSMSADRPYVTVLAGGRVDWSIVVNCRHPIFDTLDDDVDMLTVVAHAEHVLADGLVLIAVKMGAVACEPSVVAVYKDALLRSLARGQS